MYHFAVCGTMETVFFQGYLSSQSDKREQEAQQQHLVEALKILNGRTDAGAACTEHRFEAFIGCCFGQLALRNAMTHGSCMPRRNVAAAGGCEHRQRLRAALNAEPENILLQTLGRRVFSLRQVYHS